MSAPESDFLGRLHTWPCHLLAVLGAVLLKLYKPQFLNMFNRGNDST